MGHLAGNTTRGYSLNELMVVAAAREIRDRDIVFVGMRLPLIAFVVAKKTHAPDAVGLFENGVIRTTPSPELIYTMADPPNLKGATQCLDMAGVMSMLQSGRVHLGFLGAAEVDKYGNLNTTRVRGKEGWVRLPGSGGACDIASLAHRFVCLLDHARHRLPEKVSFITSPGNGQGGDWRKQSGLPRGGPSAVITSKCVLRFSPETGEACLATVHPGITLDEVRANTGWDLCVAAKLETTREPSGEELKAIRDYDKAGFWTS